MSSRQTDRQTRPLCHALSWQYCLSLLTALGLGLSLLEQLQVKHNWCSSFQKVHDSRNGNTEV